MAQFKYSEVIKGICHGEEGSICFDPADAMAFAQMLLKYGYAVLLTGGDIGDEVRVSWRFAGDVGSLRYADRDNVVFGEPDYVQMLADRDYEEDEDD